jgi:hypothetical protein
MEKSITNIGRSALGNFDYMDVEGIVFDAAQLPASS